MTDSSPTFQPAVRREIFLPASLGVGLGVTAITPDLSPESVAKILAPIVSSGFGWGLTALIAGLSARSLRSAVRAGISALVLATLTYYTLILTITLRWYHGPGETGGDYSASIDGLTSMRTALGFWLSGSVCGGAVMGLLGHIIRSGSTWRSPIAIGATFGLLAGEGTYTLLHTAFVWVGPIDSFVWGRVQSALIQLFLTMAALIVALKIRRQAISWTAFLATATVALAASIGLWHLIQSIRLTL